VDEIYNTCLVSQTLDLSARYHPLFKFKDSIVFASVPLKAIGGICIIQVPFYRPFSTGCFSVPVSGTFIRLQKVSGPQISSNIPDPKMCGLKKNSDGPSANVAICRFAICRPVFLRLADL
jgi:hypothetical protein